MEHRVVFMDGPLRGRWDVMDTTITKIRMADMKGKVDTLTYLVNRDGAAFLDPQSSIYWSTHR